MDRREFLTGLFGATTVVALPATVIALAQPTIEDWLKIVYEIHRKCMFDLQFFGSCFTQYTDEFPYIKYIPLSEVYK